MTAAPKGSAHQPRCFYLKNAGEQKLVLFLSNIPKIKESKVDILIRKINSIQQITNNLINEIKEKLRCPQKRK